MYGCSCGYEANCSSAECDYLRRLPKDPRATWGQLLEHSNAMSKYACVAEKKNPPSWLRTELTALYDRSQTVEDYLESYALMEKAGMMYHVVAVGSETSGWRDRNGRAI